jgi:signal transduction histidine kinase
MLHEFITGNREELIARCRAKVETRPAPRPTEAELVHGVPLFLDQLVETLRFQLAFSPEIGRSASRHGHQLLQSGFTAAQVVHDYGDICQSITELAVERDAPITTDEFRTLNRCLDDAIADAVTEYGRRRDQLVIDEGAERLGAFAHELRNQLTKAMLSFGALEAGSVGPRGSTAAAHGRSLIGLRDLIDRSLADVRLAAGIQDRRRILIADVIEDVEVYASMDAKARGLELTVLPVEPGVAIDGDRPILAAVVANLLQNAFKFTRPHGHVSLEVRATAERVFVEIADECGGLPPGAADELFRPFERRSADRTGLGLGLTICDRGVKAHGGRIYARNRPGAGCVFIVELPRVPAAAS